MLPSIVDSLQSLLYKTHAHQGGFCNTKSDDAVEGFGLRTCTIVVWSPGTCENGRRGAEYAYMRWQLLPDASIWGWVRGAEASPKEVHLVSVKDGARHSSISYTGKLCPRRFSWHDAAVAQ